MIIVSFDPGTCNLGCSVTTCNIENKIFKLKYFKTIGLKKHGEKVNYDAMIEKLANFLSTNSIMLAILDKAVHNKVYVQVENQRGINKKDKTALHLATQMIDMNFIAGYIIGHFNSLKYARSLKIMVQVLPKSLKWIHPIFKVKKGQHASSFLSSNKILTKKQKVVASVLEFLKSSKTSKKTFNKYKESSDQHCADSSNMNILKYEMLLKEYKKTHRPSPKSHLHKNLKKIKPKAKQKEKTRKLLILDHEDEEGEDNDDTNSE